MTSVMQSARTARSAHHWRLVVTTIHALAMSSAMPVQAEDVVAGVVAIDACALLQPADIERVIGTRVDDAERKDEGPSADGSYSSTCIWKIRAQNPEKPDLEAPMRGRSFVILNVVRWPPGLAHSFLDGFRSAAARGEIFHTPIPKSFGDEALWWGDGLAVRKGDTSFGISVFSQALKPKYHGFFEERLAPQVLHRIANSAHP